jgi:DNA polymerase elongation subunit (family B)
VQVIYAQTDSVFVHFPAASPAEAVLLGQQAAQLVTSQLPPPIELKYERVMSPFLLLHVNRWAGHETGLSSGPWLSAVVLFCRPCAVVLLS